MAPPLIQQRQPANQAQSNSYYFGLNRCVANVAVAARSLPKTDEIIEVNDDSPDEVKPTADDSVDGTKVSGERLLHKFDIDDGSRDREQKLKEPRDDFEEESHDTFAMMPVDCRLKHLIQLKMQQLLMKLVKMLISPKSRQQLKWKSKKKVQEKMSN